MVPPSKPRARRDASICSFRDSDGNVNSNNALTTGRHHKVVGTVEHTTGVIRIRTARQCSVRSQLCNQQQWRCQSCGFAHLARHSEAHHAPQVPQAAKCIPLALRSEICRFVSPTPKIPCCRKGFVDNITRYGAHVAAGIHRTMKTIVRLVQTTNKSDHMIVCMDEINTCVGCRITPTGSPNLDCIDNHQSSRQTIHHLRVLLLCARAVPAVRVCTCPVHACAHYNKGGSIGR